MTVQGVKPDKVALARRAIVLADAEVKQLVAFAVVSAGEGLWTRWASERAGRETRRRRRTHLVAVLLGALVRLLALVRTLVTCERATTASQLPAASERAQREGESWTHRGGCTGA